MDKKKLKALLMNKGFGVEGAEIAIDAVWEYLQKSQAEAIKEFAEKLKANIGDEDFYVQDKLLLMSMIESLAKEMGCGE